MLQWSCIRVGSDPLRESPKCALIRVVFLACSLALNDCYKQLNRDSAHSLPFRSKFVLRPNAVIAR